MHVKVKSEKCFPLFSPRSILFVALLSCHRRAFPAHAALPCMQYTVVECVQQGC